MREGQIDGHSSQFALAKTQICTDMCMGGGVGSKMNEMDRYKKRIKDIKNKMRAKNNDKAELMLHTNFSNLCVHVFPGSNFVTRKISRSVAKIQLGQLQCFSLGNLDSKRDWGHAKDYVEVLEHTRTFWFNSVEDVHIHTHCLLPWYMLYQPIATLSL